MSLYLVVGVNYHQFEFDKKKQKTSAISNVSQGGKELHFFKMMSLYFGNDINSVKMWNSLNTND